MIKNANDPATSSNAAKRLARLVAVQALYQASYEEETLDAILRRSLEEASALLNDEEGEGGAIAERPDPDLFAAIVRGVAQNRGGSSGHDFRSLGCSLFFGAHGNSSARDSSGGSL
jgi:transcription termination factor NusB